MTAAKTPILSKEDYRELRWFGYSDKAIRFHFRHLSDERRKQFDSEIRSYSVRSPINTPTKD